MLLELFKVYWLYMKFDNESDNMLFKYLIMVFISITLHCLQTLDLLYTGLLGTRFSFFFFWNFL